MMDVRRRALVLVLCLSVPLVACTGGASVRPDRQGRNADAVSLAENRILVTFADASIGRVSVGQPGNYYRESAGYQSSTWSRWQSAGIAEDYDLFEIAAWPITTLGVHCVVFEIAPNRSVHEVMERLSRDKRVESVQRMHRFRVLNDPYYRLQKGLRLMRIEAAHQWASGRNITVAIIDTGVDFDHPDLKGQITDSEDFVPDDQSAFVDDIHGTAVAGVIAAIADNGEGIVGIAPDSRLIALKACWPQMRDAPAAVCSSFTLAKALDRVIALKPNILNLSLTGPHDPLLTRLVHKGMEQGIVVVAADPGLVHYVDDDKFPASIHGVIAVRAANSRSRTDQESSDSQIVAPGSDILTTFPHDGYNFLSGSSLAAAQVSGVVALLLELKPDLSATRLKKILRSASDNVAPVSLPESAKIVNACAAIAKIRRSVTCDVPVAERGSASAEILRTDLKPVSREAANVTGDASLHRRF